MVPLAFDSIGSGPPLVLVHAFPLARHMWEAQAGDFPGRRLIVPDLPGFGASPRQEGGLTMESAARELAELLDSLGEKAAALCGVSMGGYVAFEFARLFPERLSALALVCTRPGPDSPQAMEVRYQSAGRVRAEGLGFLADSMPSKLLGRTSLGRSPGLIGRVRDLMLENKPEGVADALVGMARRRDSGPILSSIRCPVLVLAGAEDGLIPPAESEAMAKAIPGAKLEIVPECGHLPNLERPELFAPLVADFLARASS